MEGNILAIKTKSFALAAISLARQLQKDNEFVISKQFLRSATSIGANLREAIVWQSKKDFYAKICICYKEAHESAYWLELIWESGISTANLSEINNLLQEIIKMLAKTKLTTESNLKQGKKY